MDDTVTEGKSIAITSYILIIGVLIAMSMNAENKNKFASFHIRQALGLSLTFIAVGTIISGLQIPMMTYSLWIFIIVLWTYGFITAIKGETTPTPLLGGFYQKIFKSI